MCKDAACMPQEASEEHLLLFYATLKGLFRVGKIKHEINQCKHTRHRATADDAEQNVDEAALRIVEIELMDADTAQQESQDGCSGSLFHGKSF